MQCWQTLKISRAWPTLRWSPHWTATRIAVWCIGKMEGSSTSKHHHYSDIAWVVVSLITGNLTLCPTVLQANIKENIKVPYYWPFVRGIHHWLVDSPHKRTTSNGSWCIGIKGEMSGTVCVTFTWDIYIFTWVVYSFCLFCCLFIIVTWWYMWCIVWQVASKRKYRHVW